MSINIPQSVKEKVSVIFTVILLGLVCALVIMVCDINDVECIKSQNICKVYSHKLFQPREVTEMFKISDVMYGDVKKERTTGKYSHTYYNAVLKFKNHRSLIFYDIGFRTSENAYKFINRIQDKEDFYFKGSFIKSFFDWY